MYLNYQRRGVAQPGSAPALGAGCREFESLHPDQHLEDLTYLTSNPEASRKQMVVIRGKKYV